MNILLVGSNSMLGSATKEALKDTASVTSADRIAGDMVCDLGQMDGAFAIEDNFDCMVIFSSVFGSETAQDIYDTLKINTLGIVGLAKTSLGRVKHIIYISSISASYQPDHSYYNAYSISKRHTEEWLQFFCKKFGISFSIIRPTQIYDKFARAKKHQPLLYAIVESAANGKNFKFASSKDAYRNYIYVDDVAEIIKLVATKKVTGIFECAYPHSQTIQEIVETAGIVFGSNIKMELNPGSPATVQFPEEFDNSLFEAIGYRPPTSIAEGLNKIKDARDNTR